MGQRQSKQVWALGQTITHHQHANPAPSPAPISFVSASGLKPRPAIPPPIRHRSQIFQHSPALTTPTEIEDLTQALAALTIQPTTPQKRKHAPPDPVRQTKKRRKLSGSPVALPGSRIRGTAPHRTSIPSFPRSLLPRRTAYVPSTVLRRVTMPLARRYAVEMELDPPQPVVVLYRWPGEGGGCGAGEGRPRQLGLGDHCERELLLLRDPWMDGGEEISGGGGESGACQDGMTEEQRAELKREILEMMWQGLARCPCVRNDSGIGLGDAMPTYRSPLVTLSTKVPHLSFHSINPLVLNVEPVMTQTSPPPQEPGAWPQHKLFWLLTAEITSCSSSLDVAEVENEKYAEAREAAVQILLALRDESFLPWHKFPRPKERRDLIRKALPSVFSKGNEGVVSYFRIVKEWLDRFPKLPNNAHHEKWQAHLLTQPALTIWLDLRAALVRRGFQISDTEYPQNHISLSTERFGLRSDLLPLNARITNNNPGGTHAFVGNLKRPLPTASSPTPRLSQVVKTNERAASAPLTEGYDLMSFTPFENIGHYRPSQIANHADAEHVEYSPRNDDTSPQGAEARRLPCVTNATTVPVKAQTITSSANKGSSRDIRNPTVETIAGASQPQFSLNDFLNLQVASTIFRGQPGAGGFRHATIMEVLKDQERKARGASPATTTLAISPVRVVASIQPDSTLVVQTQREVKAALDGAMLAGKRKVAGDLAHSLLSMV
ncbi:uncharacterized protein VDAG_00823 [Verticillium dahliae VdLs.17]|uniref:Uncharacterized protein n=1 Tax=Verticillium dahliae (strain VdLs.17 / ATCC MYA-4575 / FGSC 10137) TaxID=498257 RepID=G2WSP2_VERDV|nr:uncharacterized protein VDAG_00823 [Verticillium dahliae VdLs.17]EGY17141.1 hypothetical protein VDAG_00823 [Verticillium dahliae VdLs.17]